MDIFDVSEEDYEKQFEAVREFTDREDPQEAFERKVRILCQNRTKSFYVLSYYGIGGIGKTSFVNKLCRVIKGDANSPCRLLDSIDCDYVKYDFGAEDSGKDKKSILLSLRNQLEQVNKDFAFYKFDTALMVYGQKIGADFTRDTKAASIIDDNPWLKATVTAMGLLPVGGIISGIMQTMDTLSGAIKDKVSKHINKEKYKAFLERIYGMEPSEILDELHSFFIDDMRSNMLHIAKKPVIVFLDTFEKYIDTFSADNVKITEDYWLRRGKGSVIKSIPGFMWVITGREKLDWSSDDIWDEVSVERPLDSMTEEEKEDLAQRHLEQHLIGDLSKKDATYFLDKAGIKDIQLQNQLYELTSGTPLFLDICVAQYEELVNMGKAPCIEEFGKDYEDLLNRYLFNMPSYARELAYFLACVEKWTDDSIGKILENVSCLREYTPERYEEFIDHSFIIKEGDNTYYMHKTVRDAAYQNAGAEMKRDVCLAKLSVYEGYMQGENSMAFGTYFSEYLETLMSGDVGYEEICRKGSVVIDNFKQMRSSTEYSSCYLLGKKFAEYTQQYYPNSAINIIAQITYADSLMNLEEYKKALEIVQSLSKDIENMDLTSEDRLKIQNIQCEILDMNGLYEDALGICQKVCEEDKHVFGELHQETLTALSTLASIYHSLKNYEKALQLGQDVYEKQKNVLGEMHRDTLITMHNMAMVYGDIDEHAEQIKLLKEIKEKDEAILGEMHLETITTLHNLAVAYKDVHNYEDALALMQEVYERNERIWGRAHANTLSSLNHMATLYGCTEQYEEKLRLRKEIYERRRESQGELDKNTLNALHNLAAAYGDVGNYEEALTLMKDAYEKKEKIHGELHEDTIVSLSYLAYLYEKSGNSEENLRLKEEVCIRREKASGELQD